MTSGLVTENSNHSITEDVKYVFFNTAILSYVFIRNKKSLGLVGCDWNLEMNE